MLTLPTRHVALRTAASLYWLLRDRCAWIAAAAGLTVGAAYFALRAHLAVDFRPLLSARVSIFLVLLVGCSSFALLRGGRPEKWIALLMLGQVPCLHLLNLVRPPDFGRLDLPVLILDTAVLVGMLAVTLRSNRYWPMAVAGMQICIVAFHLIRAAGTAMHPVAYGIFQILWSYPILPILAAGTWRHCLRLRDYGRDDDWATTDERADPPR